MAGSPALRGGYNQVHVGGRSGLRYSTGAASARTHFGMFVFTSVFLCNNKQLQTKRVAYNSTTTRWVYSGSLHVIWLVVPPPLFNCFNWVAGSPLDGAQGTSVAFYHTQMQHAWESASKDTRGDVRDDLGRAINTLGSGAALELITNAP
ncbi:unnamed protein product [Rhizoctonia solani]|uniref:Uncharacterized protein n=1 Tax=Rhizoctonia solani TaxID=456999 RepID=A0A8H3H1E9_9AGAM|nr:unnamed protein product [Rhizoctonia solani]CAE6475499.1 unnamed protein product [Rhizoctonia solani]CAE6479962.1 unnamed protein product [Rhizoctonia solani]